HDTQLSDQRANINNAYFIYFGGVSKIAKKITINYGNYATWNDYTNNVFSQTQYLLGGTAEDFLLKEKQERKLNNFSMKGSLYLRYQVNTNTLIEYFVNNNYQKADYSNQLNYIVNTSSPDSLMEKSEYDKNIFSQKLSFSQKINNKQAIIADFYTFEQTMEEILMINSNRFNGLFNIDTSYNHLLENINQKSTTWGVKVQLLGSLKNGKYNIFTNLENNIHPFYSQGTQNNRLNTTYLNYLFNDFTLQTQNRSVGGTYSLKTQKIDITLGITLRNITSKSNKKNNNLYIEPNFSINVKLLKGLVSFLNYSYGKSLPQAINITENSIIQNYRSIHLGTDSIFFAKNHMAIGGLFLMDFSRGLLASAFCGYMDSPYNYGTNISQFSNYTLFNTAILEGNKNTFITFKFDKSIPNLSSSLKTDVTIMKNRQVSNFFEAIPTTTINKITKYTLIYSTSFKKSPNFEVKATYTNTNTITSIEKNELNTRTSSLYFQTKIIFKSKKEKFLLTTATEYVIFNNPIQKKSFYFADIEALYKINKKTQLGVSFRNIFTPQNVDGQNTDINYITIRSQEVLPSLYLLKLYKSF
ncbi:MAG: hypothetical protein SFU27_08080, partial [Thermonemataceae bacterium]|nr:hypothetical protein [Thermonemataceae bacterium]